MRSTSIAAALALTIAPSLVAQSSAPSPGAIRSGSKLVSGTAHATRSTIDGGSDQTAISVSPSVLFFVIDRLAAGGVVSLARSTSGASTSTGWLLGPTVRYFFAMSSARTLPFVGSAVAFGRSNSESGSTTLERVLFDVEGAAGITRLVTDHVGITAEAYYRSTREERKPPSPPSASEVRGTSLGLRLGVSAFIN